MLLTSFGVSIVVQSILLQFMEGGRPAPCRRRNG